MARRTTSISNTKKQQKQNLKPHRKPNRNTFPIIYGHRSCRSYEVVDACRRYSTATASYSTVNFESSDTRHGFRRFCNESFIFYVVRWKLLSTHYTAKRACSRCQKHSYVCDPRFDFFFFFFCPEKMNSDFASKTCEKIKSRGCSFVGFKTIHEM